MNIAKEFNFKNIDIRLPDRKVNAHKNDCGRILIVGGDIGYGGAVILSSEAAIYSGAGMVHVATHEKYISSVIIRNPEVIASAVIGRQDIESYFDNKDTILIGPGMKSSAWSEQITHTFIENIQKNSSANVIDAGALGLISSFKDVPDLTSKTILTPHPGEAANLLNTSVKNIQENRARSAKEISQKYNCDVILKGKNTVVNVNDEQYICSIGGPELASAGTGDVLAGLLSSLLGQGLNNLKASMYAVALHAQAGVNLKKKYCESGITATALIGEIRGILK